MLAGGILYRRKDFRIVQGELYYTLQPLNEKPQCQGKAQVIDKQRLGFSQGS